MRNTKFIAFVIALFLVLLCACSSNGTILENTVSPSESINPQPVAPDSPTQGKVTSPSGSDPQQTATPEPSETAPTTMPLKSSGQIYLYGEAHGVEAIYDKVFELWQDHYHNENMRHFFVELGYFTAEFLNIWMQSDNDEILEQLYRDWRGTQGYNQHVRDFYRSIKNECPETVFHGTDVGHQFGTTGARYLRYLESSGLENTEQYLLGQEAIEQGRHYYIYNGNNDHAFRENMMAENFIREFDKLNGESVMGNYGAAHTGLDSMDYMTSSVPSMANQLKARYGDAVHSEDLSWLGLAIEPYRVDLITVNGVDYEASYFGEQDLTGFRDFSYREYWRLENAYYDFKDIAKTGNVLPYNSYPMLIEEGQVFVIDMYKTDGTVERMYFRSDGCVWNGMLTTEEFIVP